MSSSESSISSCLSFICSDLYFSNAMFFITIIFSRNKLIIAYFCLCILSLPMIFFLSRFIVLISLFPIIVSISSFYYCIRRRFIFSCFNSSYLNLSLKFLWLLIFKTSLAFEISYYNFYLEFIIL